MDVEKSEVTGLHCSRTQQIALYDAPAPVAAAWGLHSSSHSTHGICAEKDIPFYLYRPFRESFRKRSLTAKLEI